MPFFNNLSSKAPALVSHEDRQDFADRAPMTRFDVPEKTTRMENLIAEHKSGQDFDYISVINTSAETKVSLVQRMRAGRRQFKKEPIPINQIPILTLRKSETTITLKDALPKNLPRDSWILLKEAHFHLGVSRGYNQSKSTIVMSLRDESQVDDKDALVASITVPTNQSGDYLLSMSYAVHVDNLHNIVLKVYNQNTGVTENTPWGSLQTELVCQGSKMCFQVAVTPVSGQLHASNTDYRKYTANPYKLDLTYDGEDKDELGKFYRLGLIRDHSTPVSKKPEGYHLIGSETGGNLARERQGDFSEDSESVVSAALADNKRLEDTNRRLMIELQDMRNSMASNSISAPPEAPPLSPIPENTDSPKGKDTLEPSYPNLADYQSDQDQQSPSSSPLPDPYSPVPDVPEFNVASSSTLPPLRSAMASKAVSRANRRAISTSFRLPSADD